MVIVSVVIPVYNVEKYLEESLNSVLNQTFNDLEVICVDDGSTDTSLEILNYFKNRDSRVKVITQENRGNGGARNTGLKHVAGDYVYFMDADDTLLEDAIEKMYKNAIYNGSDLVMFKIGWLKEGKPIDYDTQLWPFDKLFKDEDFNNFTFTYKDIKYYVMNSGSFAIWAKFYKKEFLDKYSDYFIFPENTAFADVKFHVSSLILASKISFADYFLYNYRLFTPNSVTMTKSNRSDIFDIVNGVEEFLIDSEHFNEFKNEFAQFKIYQLLHYMSSANSFEYYENVKKEFLKININELSIPQEYKGRYMLLINSKNYLDYLHDVIIFNEAKNNKYHIINNTKEISRLKKENKKLIKKNTEYKNHIKTMETSHSWKLTKPLRKIKRVLKKLLMPS